MYLDAASMGNTYAKKIVSDNNLFKTTITGFSTINLK